MWIVASIVSYVFFKPVYMTLSLDVVISLDATDEFLKDRVMNLPESVVAGTHYSQHGMCGWKV